MEDAPEGDCPHCDGIATHTGRCAFAADLSRVGFFIVALDVRAGRRDWTWALDHVRRSMANRNQAGRDRAQEILDRWEHMAVAREALNGGTE